VLAVLAVLVVVAVVAVAAVAAVTAVAAVAVRVMGATRRSDGNKRVRQKHLAVGETNTYMNMHGCPLSISLNHVEPLRCSLIVIKLTNFEFFWQ
jgi:hypothetical protein